MKVEDDLFIINLVKIKIKILAPLIAFLYLFVSGSSMLCASASVYFVNKNAKPQYSQSSSQNKATIVWIINRHIVNHSKVSVDNHIPSSNLNLFLDKKQYVIIVEYFENLYQSINPSSINGRAPPIS